ncbi:MAG TPA: FeoA domain-containing protein [Pirellulales bacterium]
MDDCIPLQCLEVGRGGAVTAIVGHQDTVHRLDEIGLRQGSEVEMVQSGSPCIVRVNGQRLCLRADELLRVLVRPGVLA